MRATDVSTRALNNPKEDIGASTFWRSSGISADMVLYFFDGLGGFHQLFRGVSRVFTNVLRPCITSDGS